MRADDDVAELSSFLEAGNTSPGGFYSRDNEACTAEEHCSATEREHQRLTADWAVATGELEDDFDDERPFGANTLKMYGDWVMSAQREAAPIKRFVRPLHKSARPEQGSVHHRAPCAATPRAPPCAAAVGGASPRWHLTDELMHRPWGAVLRVLQPSSLANAQPRAVALPAGGRLGTPAPFVDRGLGTPRLQLGTAR